MKRVGSDTESDAEEHSEEQDLGDDCDDIQGDLSSENSFGEPEADDSIHHESDFDSNDCLLEFEGISKCCFLLVES